MDRASDEPFENAEAPSAGSEGLARPRTPEERRTFIKQATIVLFVAWLIAGLLFLLFATPIRPD